MNLYKNKDWLEEKYIREQLSSTQVGNIVGINRGTILFWLHKFDIPTRSCNESLHLRFGNHCRLSLKAKEWINGELLGDGNLHSRYSCSSLFQYDSKYLEYIKYVSNTLDSWGVKQRGNINEHKYKNLNYPTYCYSSLEYEELLPIRKKWYPNGKKVVPKDIDLTPLTCRQWYIGDGYLDHHPKGNPYIVLYAMGFFISDVNLLVNKLNNLGFKSTRWISNNSIYISAYSTKDFLDYIGDCPVECYRYKWDYYQGRG